MIKLALTIWLWLLERIERIEWMNWQVPRLLEGTPGNNNSQSPQDGVNPIVKWVVIMILVLLAVLLAYVFFWDSAKLIGYHKRSHVM